MATANVARFGWMEMTGGGSENWISGVIRFKMIEGKMDIQETWVDWSESVLNRLATSISIKTQRSHSLYTD